MYLFSLHPQKQWAQKLAKKSGLKSGRLNIKQFTDQEYYIQVLEKVTNQEVFVLSQIGPPADNLVKTLILLNALKSNGAKKIFVIIPFFSYSKQDRVDQPGAPVSAKLMADLLKTAGADKIISADIHSPLTRKYIGRRLVEIQTMPLLAQYFKNKKISDLTILSLDTGSIKRAKQFARLLKTPSVARAKKHRPKPEVAKILKIKGNLEGKNVIIVDDFIETGGTMTAVVEMLKKIGVKNIFAAVSHGILAGPAVKNIKRSPIKKLVLTDSIPLPPEKRLDKIEVLSVIDLISQQVNNLKK
ncbi:MAG TPA: ribose-phosphate pyrophosphokinase [Patescibacteria group bacterium]